MPFTVKIPDQGADENMKHITAATDLYLNADKTHCVPEGPDAAFLLARKGKRVSPQYTDLVTAKGNPKKPAARKESTPDGDKELVADSDKADEPQSDEDRT